MIIYILSLHFCVSKLFIMVMHYESSCAYRELNSKFVHKIWSCYWVIEHLSYEICEEDSTNPYSHCSLLRAKYSWGVLRINAFMFKMIQILFWSLYILLQFFFKVLAVLVFTVARLVLSCMVVATLVAARAGFSLLYFLLQSRDSVACCRIGALGCRRHQ